MTDQMEESRLELANRAVSSAIDAKVQERINELTIAQGNFTEYSDLLEAVKTVEDPKLRAELLDKYVGVIEENQKAKNSAMSELANSEVERRKKTSEAQEEAEKKILKAELERNELRVKLFSNHLVIVFFMCFPIMIGIGLIAYKDAYFFAFVVMIMWYGMSLALYFSQANALGDLIKIFKERIKHN